MTTLALRVKSLASPAAASPDVNVTCLQLPSAKRTWTTMRF
jgi:hypothetical protein